ncbi:MAG: metallophosphoesterase [Oscillospiraceae bacterium]|nr:metallophosphoesterase [Oscillospiraceae bacterium]MDD6147034.1 metallophosphoesterase [Oscillospiraceae bacterium]
MSIFAIADTHLSLSDDKPMDIFGGWSDYVQRLEKNWRALVDERDTVVLPGDISWAMSLDGAEKDFRFLHELPGQKIILKGNHDYWWNTKKKMDAFLAEKGLDTIRILHNCAYRVGDFSLCGTRGWFYDAETDADMKVLLREVGRLERSIQQAVDLGGEPIVFLHYPPAMQNQICEEIFSVLVKYDIKRCYYGHLHGEFAGRNICQNAENVKLSLISADYLGFTPKLIEKI